MASSIWGLFAHNFADETYTSGGATEELIAIWGKAPMIRKSNAWIRNGPNFSTSSQQVKFEFASFLNQVFLVNGIDQNWNYNGSDWSDTRNLYDSPIARYIKAHNARLYLYNIIIAGVRYPSRVWFSDFPKNNELAWGLETGSDLVQTAGSASLSSAASTFKRNSIEVGDPFLITSGPNLGEYVVQSVDSQTEITLTETLTYDGSGSSFWVGGNWFDVATDDGDIGMGLGVTSNEMFCFKRNSVYRYNTVGNELRQVKTAPGTTSGRSIVAYEDYVYWYHPSGIYRTIGLAEELISTSIQDVIDGVTVANQDNVVAWANRSKQTINFYLGTVTLRDGDTITNCVAVFDVNSKAFNLRSYPMAITVATPWLNAHIPQIYVGDTASKVYQIDTGTAFGTAVIPFQYTTKTYFPGGSEALVDFFRVRFYIDNGQDVQIQYRLLYEPTRLENNWVNNLEWKPMNGSQRGERSEWTFPTGTRASGIQFRFTESSSDESFLIEKIVIYYGNEANY